MKFSLALLVPLAVLLTACGAPDKNKFVTQAEEAGEFEIGSSRLAKSKSQNAAVQQFADQMISDHTAAAEKLRAVAHLQGVSGDKANALSSAHQADMDRLEKATVGDFDALYLDVQTKAHEDAVSLFKSYAENGDDPQLKQFATQTLPTLESHLEHVRSLNRSH
jgi:putative membrane protein